MPMRGDREPRLMQGNHGSGGGFIRRNHTTYILRRVLLVVVLLLLAFAVTRTCQSFAAFDDSGSRDNDNATKEEAVQKELSGAPGDSGKGDLGNITPSSPLDAPEDSGETDGAKEGVEGDDAGDESQLTAEGGGSEQESGEALDESATGKDAGSESAASTVVEEFHADPDAGILQTASSDVSLDPASESIVAIPIVEEPQVVAAPRTKNERQASAGRLASNADPNVEEFSVQDPTIIVPVPAPMEPEDVFREASTEADTAEGTETPAASVTVVEAEPVVAEPVVEEPVVEAEPMIEAEPVIEPEPVVEAEPVVETAPEPVVEDSVVVEADSSGEASATVSGGRAKATAGDSTAIVDDGGAIAVSGEVEASVGPDGPKVKVGKGKAGKRGKGKGQKNKKFKGTLVSAEEIIAATEAATP